MRRSVLTSLVVGLALLAGSCGGQPVESVDTPTTRPAVSTTEPPTTSTTLAMASTTTGDVQLIEKYLVEMSNLDGDLLDSLTRFEEEANQSTGDGGDDPSEEDMLRYWGGNV